MKIIRCPFCGGFHEAEPWQRADFFECPLCPDGVMYLFAKDYIRVENIGAATT